MAEKNINIENVLVPKNELLKMRTSIIHSLADKKIHLEHSNAYLENGNRKNFCNTYGKSFYVHAAVYLLLASLLGIMATWGFPDSGINSVRSCFVGLATGAIMILVVMAIASISEVLTRNSVERSNIELYDAQIDTAHSWLATVDSIIGVTDKSSEKEVNRLIIKKKSSSDFWD